MRRSTVAVLAVVLGLGVTACGDDEPSAGPFGIDRPGDPGMPGGPGHVPSSGALVEGDGYEGVLLDAGLDWLQRSDGTVVEDVTTFVPAEADVERFEAELDTEEPTDLTGYVRQYTGVASDGGDDRHLVVAGICATAADAGGSLDDWRDGWIEVADGGDCFWDATMDLTSGDLLRFGFHGSA